MIEQEVSMPGGSSNDKGEGGLDNQAWETLVESVVSGTCTPFLGAGVAMPHLPSGRLLAQSLAREFDYPLPDTANLARVTQYIATVHQPAYARRRVGKMIAEAQDRFTDSTDGPIPRNYHLLANLNVPIFITTNYDEFLQRALAATHSKSPRLERCRWNDQLCEDLPEYSPVEPRPSEPLVFHLHGHLDNEPSILVTEDDYIDFTVSLGQRTERDPVVPHWIRRALSRTTLLFIGYSLEDWNFRVLMRHLMKQQRVLRSEQAFSLSIQMSDPSLSPEQRRRAEKFLADYVGTSAIRIHWGPASPFLEELSTRVKAARDHERR